VFRSFWLGSCLALVVAGCVGCGANAPPPPAATQSTPAEADDHHHGDAPHGGTIADWGGGEYHVEFTVDHDRNEAVVYVLGSDAKSPAPIDADRLLLSIDKPSFQVELVAQPLEGEAGMSSRFVGQHDSLGVVQEFAGTISGVVAGVPYAGDFAEQPHDH
jgi:hypothetical protein